MTRVSTSCPNPSRHLPKYGSSASCVCSNASFVCVGIGREQPRCREPPPPEQVQAGRTSLCSCVNPHTQKMSWRVQWQLQVSQNSCGTVIRVQCFCCHIWIKCKNFSVQRNYIVLKNTHIGVCTIFPLAIKHEKSWFPILWQFSPLLSRELFITWQM